jgi:radical SAM protein with 4Fe4S-binding SPASM domain
MKGIRDISGNFCSPEICITGGEAWLTGYDYIARCVEIIRRNFAGAKITMMTNLLGYDKQIGNAIKELDIQVGTSFDPEIRRFNGCHKEFKKIWITKYREAKSDGFDLPVAFTITKHLLDFDVVRFAELLEIKSIVLRPFLAVGRGSANMELMVSLPEASDYTTEVKRAFSGDVTYAINDCKDDCFKNNYLITASGYVGSCEVWGDINGNGIYGSINSTAEEIYYSPNRLNFISRRMFLITKCFGCEYINRCHGGCSCIRKQGECLL